MIDVIIPVYGQAALLLKCLKSIRNNTTVPYRIMIADDPKDDPGIEDVYNNWQTRINLTRNTKRLGFPKSCNAAINRSDSDLFVLLNSDTRVHKGWLRIMQAEFEDPRVGAVGVKLVYSPGGQFGGLVQHAGVATNTDGYPYHIYRMFNSQNPLVNRRLELNCVTFACVMIRRECWDEVGTFDGRFGMGNCEDVDWCWRARENGWKIVYQPKVEVYHREHGSFGESLVNQLASKNMKMLARKWRKASDEYLFSPPDLSSIEGVRNYMAEQFHRAMQEVYSDLTRDPRAVVSMRYAMKTNYAELDPKSKRVASRYADMVIARLRESE